MYNKSKDVKRKLVLNDIKIILPLILSWGLIIAAILFVPPYFEAQAFNRLTTGPKATFWDAVFLDLPLEASGVCK